MNIFIIIHALLLICIIGFTALLFHYKREYSYRKEHHQWVMIVFMVIITLLMLLSTVLFFQIPWHDIRQLLL
ncbi:MAG: hypothetical protein HY445_02520 [Candidatus Niyogibacteria bacterium]|nr:hypothetical protein [Candidatus Niyogibacteria bacterium]